MRETIEARHARREADALVGGGREARVLEPSPPAVADDPWFADDPVELAGAEPATVVAPGNRAGTQSWDQWLVDHPQHARWVTERWLGGPRRLPPVPSGLATTREALHRLAAYVIAPARHAATGRFGLRWTLGGFGTPFFGDDRQIRVDGTTLVDQRGGQVRTAPITSLAAAAELFGTAVDPSTAAEPDSTPVGDVDAELGVDEASSRFLGAWYGMAFAALEDVRAEAASVDPGRVQLWPGHFDAALEVGDDDHRASYGASPGDASSGPYLYVSVWWPDRLGLDRAAGPEPGWWNATTFPGRLLRLADFPPDTDPVAVAARFFSATRDSLPPGSGPRTG